MKVFVFFFLFFFYSQAQYENRTITVAVVEYQPIRDKSLTYNATILANTHEYVNIIKTLSPSKVDLIIFPEKTLLMLPPDGVEVEINDNPCNSPKFPLFLRQLSCAAREANAYLVVNLVDKEKCQNSVKNCQDYGFLFFNTNLVFDRLGTIVSRYRKHNLFGEKEFDSAPPEQVTVTLDVGVTYGMFICFDMLFKSPAQDILEKNLDGVIYPSMWHSELPFLTALQTQHMWAYTHDVKVFSAGANNPEESSGGSGFFSGAQGMIIGDIVAKGGSRAYIYKYVKGEVPDYNPQEPTLGENVDSLGRQMDAFPVYQDPSVTEYSSIILNLSESPLLEEVCYKDQLCCHFSLEINVNDAKMADKKRYSYHLVAYSGVRSLGGAYNAGIELCGVIACLNSSLSSCGQRFDNYDDVYWPITFEKIEIKANFERSDNRTQFPNSLLSSFRPINASLTTWEGKEVVIDGKTMIERSFSTKESQNRLLTFAIYGRKFDEDSPPDDGNSSPDVKIVDLLVMVILVILSIVL